MNTKRLFGWIFWTVDVIITLLCLYGMIAVVIQEIDFASRFGMLILSFFLLGYTFAVPDVIVSAILTPLHGFKEIDSFLDLIIKILLAPVIVAARIYTRIKILLGGPQFESREILFRVRQVSARVISWIIEAGFLVLTISSIVSLWKTSGFFPALLGSAFAVYFFPAISMILHMCTIFIHGVRTTSGFDDFIESLKFLPLVFLMNFAFHFLAIFGLYNRYAPIPYYPFFDEYDYSPAPKKVKKEKTAKVKDDSVATANAETVETVETVEETTDETKLDATVDEIEEEEEEITPDREKAIVQNADGSYTEEMLATQRRVSRGIRYYCHEPNVGNFSPYSRTFTAKLNADAIGGIEYNISEPQVQFGPIAYVDFKVEFSLNTAKRKTVAQACQEIGNINAKVGEIDSDVEESVEKLIFALQNMMSDYKKKFPTADTEHVVYTVEINYSIAAKNETKQLPELSRNKVMKLNMLGDVVEL